MQEGAVWLAFLERLDIRGLPHVNDIHDDAIMTHDDVRQEASADGAMRSCVGVATNHASKAVHGAQFGVGKRQSTVQTAQGHLRAVKRDVM